MKNLTVILRLCCLIWVAILCTSLKAAGTTYYNTTAATMANSTASWTTNSGGGSGTAPTNFVTAGDVFIVRASTTLSTNGIWTVTGSLQVLGTLSIGTTNTWSITIGGTTTVSGTFNMYNTSSKTFADVTVNSGGTWYIDVTNVAIFVANLTVNSGGTLKHYQNYSSPELIYITGNLNLSGTYDYTGHSPALFMNAASGTKTITTGTTSVFYLLCRTATYNQNGPVTCDGPLYAMWNTGAGSYHTNGQTLTCNWGLVNSSGTFYVDGGSTVNIYAGNGGLLSANTIAGDPLGATVNVISGTLNTPGISCGLTLAGNNFTSTFIQSGGTIHTTGLTMNQSSTFTFSNSPVFTTNTTVNSVAGTGDVNIISGTMTTSTSGTPSITIANDLNISSGGTFTNVAASNPATDINGDVVNAGTLTTVGTTTMNVAGNWTNTGTSTSAGGTVTFDGTSNQVIGGTSVTTFNNLTINPSAGVVVSIATTSPKVASNCTVTTGIFDLGTFTCNRATSGGTLAVNAAGTLRCGGSSGGQTGSNYPLNFTTNTLNATGTVEYNGANGVSQTVYAPVTYGNLTLTNATGSGSSVKSLTANITGIGGNLTVNSYATYDLGTFTSNRSSAGGTIAVNAAAILKLGASTGGQTGSNYPSSFTTNTLNATSTVEYNGANTVNQTVYAPVTYGNLTLTNATGAGSSIKSLTASVTGIAGNVVVNPYSIFDLSTFTANRSAGSGTLTVNANAQMKLAASTGGQTGSNFPSGFPATLDAASLVEYYGANTVNQTVYAPVTYGNLTLTNSTGSGSSVKSLTANVTGIAGSVIVNSYSTFDLSTFTANRSAGAGTLTVNANAIMKVGASTGGQTGSNFPSGFPATLNATSTVEYNAATTVNQTVYAPVTYGNLTISNITGSGSSVKSLTANITGIAGTVAVNAYATFDLSAYTANRSAGAGTLTVNDNAFMKLGGSTGGQTGSNFPTGFPVTLTSLSTVDYSGANTVNQTVYAPITYGNLTISNSTGSGSSIKSLTANVTGIAGNLTVNGYATFDLSTFTSNRSAGTGTMTVNDYGIMKLGASTGGQTGSNFPTGFPATLTSLSTVEYNSATTVNQTVYAPVTYGNLTLTNVTGSGSSTKSLSANITGIAGSVVVNSYAIFDLLTFTANRSAGSGTITVNANGQMKLAASTGGQTGSNFPSGFPATLDAASTVEYYGANTVNQTVYAPVTYGNLTLTNSTGSGSSIKSLTANVTGVAGSLVVNSYSTFDLSTFTANRSAGAGTLTLNANTFMKLAGSTGGQTGSNFPSGFPATLNATSTVEYYGANTVNQTVYAPVTYGNLTLTNSTGSGSSVKSLTANITGIAGTVIVNSYATFDLSSYTANRSAGAGTLTVNDNAFMKLGGSTGGQTGSNFPTGFPVTLTSLSTVDYNAANTVNQTVYAPITYGNLTISNSTGSGSSVKSLTANVTGIAGNLTVNGYATFDLSTFTSNRSAGTGTMTVNDYGIMKLGASTGGQTGSNFPTGFPATLTSLSTVEYNGANTVNQTVYAPVTYGNLTLTNSTGSGSSIKSITANITGIAGSVVVNSYSTFDLSTLTANRSAGSGTLTVNDNAFLRLAASTGGQTGSNFPSGFPATLTSLSTVEYYGANTVNQTVYAPVTYGNLTLTNSTGSGSSIKSLTANVTGIAGSVAVNSYSTFDLSTFTANRSAGSGTLTVNASAFMKLAGSTGGQTGSNFPSGFPATLNATSTVEYYGANTVNQTVYAPVTYGNLTLTNSTGSGTSVKSLTANITGIAGTVIVNSYATFDLSSYTANRSAGAGTLTVNDNAFMKLGGSTGGQTGSNFPTGFPVTLTSLSTVDYNAANTVNQTVYAPITYGNLTISNSTGSGSSVKSLTANVTGIAGNLAVNGYATFDLSTFTANRSAGAGTMTVNDYGFMKLGASTGGQTGSNFPTGFPATLTSLSTVEYNAANTVNQTVYAPVTYGNLTLTNVTGSGSSTKSLTANITGIAGSVVVNAYAIFDLSTFTANRSAGAGTLTVNANAQMKLAASTGGQTGSNFPGGFPATLDAASTVEYNGANTVNQTVYAPVTYGNLTLTNSTGSGSSVKSLTANVTGIAGSVAVNAYATFDLSTFTANRSAGSGTLTVNANAAMKLGASTGGQTGSNFPTGFPVTLNAASTVEYNSATTVNQTVYAPITYGNLTLTNATGSGSSTKSLTANITGIAGSVVVNGYATFDLLTYTANRSAGAGTLTVNANGYMKLAASTGGQTGSNFPTGFPATLSSGSTVEYNGSNAITQTIYDAVTYSNLQITNGSGSSRAAKITAAAVSATGTISINALADLTLGSTLASAGAFTVQSTGGLYCAANIVSGAGAFTLSSGAYMGIGHGSGIASGTTISGNMQMTGGRGFSTGANYTYNGTGTQITGTGLPSTCNDLKLDNPTTVTIASDQISTGVVTLKQGTFDIGTTKLTVTGNGTLTSVTGLMKANVGLLEMNGSSGTAQSLDGSWFTGRNISTLINSNTKGVTLAATSNDTLLISSALLYGGSTTNSTITTNDNLTLLSRDSSTARFGEIVASSGNTISGKVNVERYIRTYRKWRLLAWNTSSSQTAQQSWMDKNYSANNNGTPGYGTIVTDTAATWSANGFDSKSVSGPSVKYYDPATNKYLGIPNTNSYAMSGQSAYYNYVRGDRSCTPANPYLSPTVLRTTGTLNTGNQVFNVTMNKYAMIGNPYASAVDLRKIDTSGLTSTFYIWDPLLTGTYGQGGYQTVYQSGANYLIIPGGGSYGSATSAMDTLESGQGFFVKARSTGAGTLTFKEVAKNIGKRTLSRDADQQPPQVIGLLSLHDPAANTLIDGVLTIFDDAYSNDVDDNDISKLQNTSENLSFKRNGTPLSIERRHTVTANDTLFFNLTNERAHDYQFDITLQNIDSAGRTAFFVDKYTNTSTPLSFSGTNSIVFTVVNIAGSYAPDRFMIVFRQTAVVLPVRFTSIAAARNTDKTATVTWKTENESNLMDYRVERSTDGRTFTQIGTKVPDVNSSGSHVYSLIDLHASDGTNYYRVKANSLNGEQQYTAVVTVGPLASGQSFSIYPNPVTGGNINLRFDNEPKGTYTVRVIDMLGRELHTETMQADNDHFTQMISIGAQAVPGSYSVILTDKAGNTHTIPFIVK